MACIRPETYIQPNLKCRRPQKGDRMSLETNSSPATQNTQVQKERASSISGMLLHIINSHQKLISNVL